MNNDLVKSIIKNLTDATKDGNLKWTISNSLFNNDTCKSFETFSEDKTTKFQTFVEMNNNLSFKSDGKFIIFNQGLVDGMKYCFLSDFPEIINLNQVIYDIYVKPTIVVKNEKVVLENILGSISSKQESRDKKIDEILGNKSFINKLFGK